MGERLGHLLLPIDHDWNRRRSRRIDRRSGRIVEILPAVGGKFLDPDLMAPASDKRRSAQIVVLAGNGQITFGVLGPGLHHIIGAHPALVHADVDEPWRNRERIVNVPVGPENQHRYWEAIWRH